MTEVICFASSKGGSGKTTITATIGTFLAKSGRKVLLIDCDEGTHGLTLMYLDEVNSHRKRSNHTPLGTFDLKEGFDREQLGASTITIENNLSLLPGRHVFSDFDLVPVGEEFQSYLTQVINYFRDEFDFILLDAQAGISAASKAAMSPGNSDIVILASEYDPMSNAGIERLKARLPDELDVGRTWILLNKLLPEFVSKFSEFLSVARYLPPIPWTADVVRAYSRRKLALDFDDGNQFTLAILAVLRELLGREDRELLDEWIEAQTQRLKEPIDEQLADAESMLHRMQKMSAEKFDDETSFPSFLLTKFANAFGVATAVAAIFALVFAVFIDSKLVIEAVFSDNGSLFLIASLSILVLLILLSEAYHRSMVERRDRLRRLAASQFGELNELKIRVAELKALKSAGFEDIVAQQKRKREP